MIRLGIFLALLAAGGRRRKRNRSDKVLDGGWFDDEGADRALGKACWQQLLGVGAFWDEALHLRS